MKSFQFIIQMLHKKLLCSLIILLTVRLVRSIQVTSAIRMCDSYDCQLQLQLINSNYYFMIPSALLISKTYFVFCFRERTVEPGNSNTCSLAGQLNTFTCLDIIPTISNAIVTDLTITTWNSDSSLTNSNKTSSNSYSDLVITKNQIQINIKQLISTNTIYQILAGYVVNLISDYRTKNGFFMTFQVEGQIASDNLLMQRNVVCSLFYYKQYYNYNLLFYGGTVRGGNDTLFLHALSYLKNIDGSFPFDSLGVSTLDLNVWIGITFSPYGHAGQDVIAFISDNSTTLDMYSIYYAPPFYDTSPNIKGTVDVIDIGDSNNYNQDKNVHYYWTGASRKYITDDKYGDDAIIKKMNTSLSYSIGYNPSTGPYSPSVAANKHNFYNTFYFNVELWQSFLFLSLLTILISLFIFV